MELVSPITMNNNNEEQLEAVRGQWLRKIYTELSFAHDFFYYYQLTNKDRATCREISKDWRNAVDGIRLMHIELLQKCDCSSFPISIPGSQSIKNYSNVSLLKASMTLSLDLKKIYGIMESQLTIDKNGAQIQQPVYEFCTCDIEVHDRSIFSKDKVQVASLFNEQPAFHPITFIYCSQEDIKLEDIKLKASLAKENYPTICVDPGHTVGLIQFPDKTFVYNNKDKVRKLDNIEHCARHINCIRNWKENPCEVVYDSVTNKFILKDTAISGAQKWLWPQVLTGIWFDDTATVYINPYDSNLWQSSASLNSCPLECVWNITQRFGNKINIDSTHFPVNLRPILRRSKPYTRSKLNRTGAILQKLTVNYFNNLNLSSSTWNKRMIKTLCNLYGIIYKHPLQDFFGYNYSLQEYADMYTLLHYANLQQDTIFTEELKKIRNNLWFPIASFRTSEINIEGTIRTESNYKDCAWWLRLCAYILPKRYGSIPSCEKAAWDPSEPKTMRVYTITPISDAQKTKCAQNIQSYESCVPQFNNNHTFEEVSTGVFNHFMNCVKGCAGARGVTIIQQSLARRFLNWCFSLSERPFLWIVTPILSRLMGGM
jgi:hypothetical protein